MILWQAAILLAFAWVSSTVAKEDTPIIEISTGKIKGDDKESRDDKDFFAYRGIPYAQPPKGILRFEPPQPPANWSKVKETEDYEKECLQYDSFAKKVTGSEDCLYLNVFTPKFGEGVSKTLLPVMVYIHGGFFMSGNAKHYKPNYFMDHKVVIVTFSYRLGAFGFLNTGDGTVRGNMGLKDQVMALKWVQREIRKFGGDPNKVTLFGEGAGASSVHYHLLSPMSKGLFQRGISQSGTAISLYALQPRPAEASQRLARLLKCSDTLNTTKDKDAFDYLGNSTALVQCLKKVDAKKIAEIHQETWSPLRHPLSVFLPSVETTHKSSNDTFLTEHPYSLIISGKQRRIPWITGFNAEEGLHITSKISNTKDLSELIENRWDDVSGTFLSYDNTRTDITEKIRRYYIDPPVAVPLIHTTTTTTTTTTTPVPTVPTIKHGPGVQVPLPTPLQSIYPHLPAISPPQSRASLPQQHVPAHPILAPHNASHILPQENPTSISTTPGYVLEQFESKSLNFEQKFKMFTRLFTDRFFTTPLFRSVQIQSKYSPVYVYYNNYQSKFSFVDVYAGKTQEPVPAMKRVSSWFKTKILGRTTAQPEHMGVCHGDELPLLFKYPEAKIKDDAKDYAMSKSLIDLWLQFASAEQNIHLQFKNVTWPPVGPVQNSLNNVLQFSNTDRENKPLNEVFNENKIFWESLDYLPTFKQ